jgi:group I intron endonuclease
MIIYKIENKINGKIYIGKTTKLLNQRIAGHIKQNHSRIQKALRKYGIESFIISTIDSATSQESLNEKEKYWIKTLNCQHPNGYNFTIGGDGGPTWTGGRHTQETIKKMKERKFSEEHKQKLKGPKSEEHKQKISKALSGERNPNYGKPLSEETKLKKRLAMLGRKDSEETKLKKKNAATGKHPSDETRIKQRESHLGQIWSDEAREKSRKAHLNKSHICSDETKEKIRKSRLNIKHSKESKEKMSKIKKGKPWNQARRDAYNKKYQKLRQ